MSVNYGGVTIVTAAGTQLTAVDVDQQPTTFEIVAARVSSGPSSCIAVVIYRPGSSPVTDTFFTELAKLLDRLTTYVESLITLCSSVMLTFGLSALPIHILLGSVISSQALYPASA